MIGYLAAACARRIGNRARDKVVIAKEKWVQRIHSHICNAWDGFCECDLLA
jgi:hypothetical protein